MDIVEAVDIEKVEVAVSTEADIEVADSIEADIEAADSIGAYIEVAGSTEADTEVADSTEPTAEATLQRSLLDNYYTEAEARRLCRAWPRYLQAEQLLVTQPLR